MIQPAGRTWDYFYEVLLRWGAAVLILGTVLLLGVAYLVIGRLRIESGRSGLKILRFKAIERFSHWLTAVSFVILALTGLNITFGKKLLLPVIGPETFSTVSQAAKYIHNFVSFAFVVGLVLIAVIFIKDNLFNRVDLEWLKRGGGFIKSKHAPAERFNFGEKLVFWLSLAAGLGAYLRLPSPVSVLRHEHPRHAGHPGGARRRCRPVYRADPRPHLYWNLGYGGRIRGDGNR